MDYIEQAFPNILNTGYSVTSPNTITYNCIAWAAGYSDKWWWPDIAMQYYWPPNIPRIVSLGAFISMFKSFGYLECKNGKLQKGFEKVVIYIDQTGLPTHAAKQLSSGKWTSKLGKEHDIEHVPEGLVNSSYGQIGQFMKRKLR